MLGGLGSIVSLATDSCVTVFSLISSTLSFSLNLSYVVGQLIVKFGIAVVALLVDGLLGLQTLVQVLSEDYLIFLSDIRAVFSFLFKVILDIGDFFLQGLLSICSTFGQGVQILEDLIFFVIFSVTNFFGSILSAIYYCLVVVKNSLVLLGLTSWDIFVFIPNTAITLRKELVSVAVRCMAGIRDGVNSFRLSIHRGVKETLVFVSDIPKESLYGLCVCLLVCFVFIKYHRSIRPLLVRNSLYILSQSQRTLVTAWAYLEAFTLWLLTNQMTPSLNGARQYAPPATATAGMPADVHNMAQEQDQSDEEDEDGRRETTGQAENFERKVPSEPEERLCVVCQDSERCTIILPCRHVCLCYECCSTIKRTHGRCPICRHVVRRTMRVYI